MTITEQEICQLIISAEKRAGELILHAHHVMAEEKTDARNVVTEYDKKVQEMLIELLSAVLPDAHFFCEEMAHPDSLNAEHVFIIDPIDGTMNFVHGFGHSCISVGYMHNGKMAAGAVFNPYKNELFSAVNGQGAYLNGKKIRTASSSLAESVACVGTSPYNNGLTERTFDLIRKVFQNSLDIRREGAAALDLCSIASGRAGLYFELELSFWDYAAGMLIATEAGARCCTISGENLPLDGKKTSVLAGTPHAVQDFLELDQ